MSRCWDPRPARRRAPASYLSVLYAAVKEYGSPEALVTDGGGIFRARQARAVYGALGIAKHEIERGRPWQSYNIETAFNVQRRMADWHFARAENWPELVEAHDRFVEDYNAQAHFAHRSRSPQRRLFELGSLGEGGWLKAMRLEGYAPRAPPRTQSLQEALFQAPPAEAL